MSLSSEQTHWIFLSASRDESEERHIYDIAFGVYCLESRGINPTSITLIIDGTDRNRILALIKNASNYAYDIQTSDCMFDLLTKNTYENIVLFVTGHGNIEGITSNKPFKPYPLFNSIKMAPHLRMGIVYLGQCYAGIFNFMDVSGKRDGDSMLEPPLIVIGATNLFESISSSTKETLLSVDKTWEANLFLLYLFRWIKSPIDVDGDGKFTVMDSYKFASASANINYKQVKSQYFLAPFQHIESLRQIEKDIKMLTPTDPTYSYLLLKKQALERDYFNVLNIRFNHQESWILNSIPAQSVEF
jgi:hypothetical protein